MSAETIPGLGAVVTLSAAAQIWVNQDGADYRATAGQIAGVNPNAPTNTLTPANRGGTPGINGDATAAIQSILSEGRPLDLDGQFWKVTTGLTSGDNDLIIYGEGGGLYVPGDDGLTFNPTWPASIAITNITTAPMSDFGTTDVGTVTKLTVASVATLTVGDVVQVSSSDPALCNNGPGAAATLGELTTIQKIDTGSKYVWLAHLIDGNFVTTPLLTKLPTKQCKIFGFPTITCYDDYATAPFHYGALVLKGAVRPYVEIAVEFMPSRGLFAAACWQGHFKTRTKDLRDDQANGRFGYGADAVSCSRYCVFEVLEALRNRHAFTSNLWGTAELWMRGNNRDCYITGSASECSSAAFDNHAGSFDLHYFNLCVDQDIAADSASPTGTRMGFQDRSVRTTLDGMTYSPVTGGTLYLDDTNADPGYNYTNRYSNLVFRGNETGGVAFGPAFAGGLRATREFRNCAFDNINMASFAACVLVRFFDTSFQDVQLFRPDQVPVEFHNCRRLNISGTAQEPVRVKEGGGLSAYGYTSIGPYTNSSMFRAVTGGTPGTNLVVNGDFATGTISGWTDASDNPPGWSVAANVATTLAVSGTRRLRQAVTVVPGKRYTFLWGTSAAICPYSLGTAAGASDIKASGQETSYSFIAPTSTVWINAASGSTGQHIENVSLTQVLMIATGDIMSDGVTTTLISDDSIVTYYHRNAEISSA